MIRDRLKIDYDKLDLKANKYLLAFSGGPDSVFLLVTLANYFKGKINDHIELAYVNYHDSDEVYIEEEIVSYYVNKYNLTLNRLDTKCPENENFEDWARTIRYNYFKDVINKKQLDGVLVAHQQDDLIETYTIQKNRKSFPRTYGLKYMTINNELKIFRPILNIKKEEIYSYLKKNKIRYYEDKTNQNLLHERNRLRLNKLNDEEIDSIISEINGKNRWLDALYFEFDHLNRAIEFDFYVVLNVEKKKRLIFYLLNRDTSLDYLKIEKESKNIYSFLKKRETNYLKFDSYYLCKIQDRFFILDSLDKEYQYKVLKPRILKTPFFEVDLTKLDINLIKGYPLKIRNYHEGDIFKTDIFEKDVASFLKKHQVPFFLKKIYPVILYKDDVIYSPFYKEILNRNSPFKLPYLNYVFKKL